MNREKFTIYVKVEGGVLTSVYGDPVPENIELNFVPRDMDNIKAGEDIDPYLIPSLPDHYYW